MQNFENPYIESLVLFVDELRKKGLAPGLAETFDSVRALIEMGLTDKQQVKAALRALLARSPVEQKTFDEVFCEYFVGEETLKSRYETVILQEEKRVEVIEQSKSELKFQDVPLELEDSLMEAYGEMPEEDKNRLQDFLEKTSKAERVCPKHKMFLERLVAERLRAAADAGTAGAVAAEGVEGTKGDLLYRDISLISDAELPRALALIRSLVKQINGSIARYYRRSSRGHNLDFRSTIHAGLRTGGSFYTLKFKKRPRNRQRMVMLCDISGSMYRFSGFALQFIKDLSIAMEKSQAFVFSEGVESVDLSADMAAFEKKVTSSDMWRKGTNIGSALENLLTKNNLLGPSTVLLIFSDAKTVDIPFAEEYLKRASRRVRKVIWMNPLSKEEWRSQRAVTLFDPYCTMLDCSTLDNLAQACRALR